jgi:hypothetical protein
VKEIERLRETMNNVKLSNEILVKQLSDSSQTREHLESKFEQLCEELRAEIERYFDI